MARPRTFDEPTVVLAARDAFWEHGYAGTSLDVLRSATGLGKGSLYGAFGDKRELFGRVFDRYCADVVDAAGHALAGPDEDAVERLRSYVTAEAPASGGPAQRGCLIAKTVAELAQHDPDVRRRARETYAAIEGHLTAAVEAAQRHGALDADRDARVLAQTLLVLQRGLEALGRAGAAVQVRALVDTAFASFQPSAPHRAEPPPRRG